MRQSHDDITLHEGDNELSVQLTPTAPPFDPWSYDTDGNGCLDEAELGKASVDYFNGVITKEDNLAVLALPRCACTPGATKCEGYDLYTCNGTGKWSLTEVNSPSCGYTPPPVGGTLEVLVIHADTDERIAGVRVEVSSYIAYTDTNGRCTISGIEPGTYRIYFTKSGFKDSSTSRTVSSGQTKWVHHEMAPS